MKKLVEALQRRRRSENDAELFVYGLPPKRKKLTDSLAVLEASAVVYSASVVGSYLSRADMESASPMRQSLQAAVNEPEELSASVGVG